MTGTSEGRGELRAALPLLVAGFIIEFFVIGGGIDTVSVFLNALSKANDWPHSTLSAGIGVGVLAAGLATPGVGLLTDRFGVRVPLVAGAALLAAGFGVVSWMTEAWHFVIANLLLGPGFAGAGMLAITVAVAHSVPTRTALAVGIVATGSSVGALVLAPLVQAVIEASDWRTAYYVLGAAVVAAPLLCLPALPRGRLVKASLPGPGLAASGVVTPPPVEAPFDLRKELRRPGIVPLALLLIAPGIVNFGLQVHLVPLLASEGHGPGVAAAALGGAIGIAALGKVMGGFVGDRFGTLPTLRAAFLAQLVALAILFYGDSPLALWIFVTIHGLALGTEIAVTPVIAIRILGTSRFGTLYGLLQLAATVVMGLAPIVPGVLFDRSGSYQGTLVFWVATMAVGTAVLFRMRVPERWAD